MFISVSTWLSKDWSRALSFSHIVLRERCGLGCAVPEYLILLGTILDFQYEQLGQKTVHYCY